MLFKYQRHDWCCEVKASSFQIQWVMKKTKNSRTAQEFGDDIQPRAGFVYPKVGDKILTVVGYETAVMTESVVIPANAVGEVIEVRKPGTFDQVQGHMGCSVFFEEFKRHYPCGLVIPWDKVSDPKCFKFLEGADSPRTTEPKPEKNLVTAQRAQEYNLPPQGPDESESAFKNRISGALRDMGHIIEAHEAATGKLYNDGGDDPMSNPMTGIMGVLAQKMQGVDYHQSASNQVGMDVAAGYVATHKKPGALEGLSPELLVMAAALFGGR